MSESIPPPIPPILAAANDFERPVAHRPVEEMPRLLGYLNVSDQLRTTANAIHSYRSGEASAVAQSPYQYMRNPAGSRMQPVYGWRAIAWQSGWRAAAASAFVPGGLGFEQHASRADLRA